jgi:hypothetical protein
VTVHVKTDGPLVCLAARVALDAQFHSLFRCREAWRLTADFAGSDLKRLIAERQDIFVAYLEMRAEEH